MTNGREKNRATTLSPLQSSNRAFGIYETYPQTATIGRNIHLLLYIIIGRETCQRSLIYMPTLLSSECVLEEPLY